MEGRQVAPRDAHVDVVGQVPPGVVGHQPEAGAERLSDVVGGDPAVRDGLEPTVFADRPQPVEHTPLGHPREPPQQRVDPPAPGGRPGHGPQQGLDPQDRQADASERAGPHRLAEHLEVLPARDAHGVAPSRRRSVAGRTVAPVEGQVGLVGSELLAMVGEVPPPVEADGRERRIGDQPRPDPVVDGLVGEEQLVGGLVHQDGEPDVERPHHDERHQVGHRVADQTAAAPPPTTIAHSPATVRRCAGRRSAAARATAGRLPVRQQPLARQHLGPGQGPGPWCPPPTHITLHRQ